jgi:hypothetical protein
VAIPLPLQSPNIPIRTHILIRHRHSIVPIYWNISLPPSTAHLAGAIYGVGGPWYHDVAVVPAVSSIAIRIRGVARAVVVFPVEAGLPIRIVDVLRAVYNVVRAEALEVEDGAGARADSRHISHDDSIAADAIRRYLRNRIWWNGLSQSMDEVDVWVLHLRRPAGGRFL